MTNSVEKQFKLINGWVEYDDGGFSKYSGFKLYNNNCEPMYLTPKNMERVAKYMPRVQAKAKQYQEEMPPLLDDPEGDDVDGPRPVYLLDHETWFFQAGDIYRAVVTQQHMSVKFAFQSFGFDPMDLTKVTPRQRVEFDLKEDFSALQKFVDACFAVNE